MVGYEARGWAGPGPFARPETWAASTGATVNFTWQLGWATCAQIFGHYSGCVSEGVPG